MRLCGYFKTLSKFEIRSNYLFTYHNQTLTNLSFNRLVSKGSRVKHDF